MLGAIVILLISCAVIWVYWDATAHKIGKLPDQTGFFNMSAGAWSFVTFWWLGFIAYLLKRDKLIQLAKAHPVEIKGRRMKLAILCVVGALYVAFGLSEAKW